MAGPPAAPAEAQHGAASRSEVEAQAVRERYARRTVDDPRYRLTNAAALMAHQERQRAVAALFRSLGWQDLSTRCMHEVGCGTGSNLLEALQLGFRPEHLSGVELLAERHRAALERLPQAVRLWHGDAVDLAPPPASMDVVLQSTVFSSILDDAVQQRLAERMWQTLKPGGGVLWYDFCVDNPRNPDVRGVPLARVRALFAEGRIQSRRVTLAPPLARHLVRLHPAGYTLLNILPWLRTHRLAWIQKNHHD